MAWFRCFIHGENFPGQLIGRSERVGFYITRFVEGPDAAAAESTALQELGAELKLAMAPGYLPSSQARVYFEEIEEMADSVVPALQTGFAWYSMEDADV